MKALLMLLEISAPYLLLFLIDKNGYIVAKYEGIVSRDTYIENIEKVLKNKYNKTGLVKIPNFSLYLIEPNK